MNVLFVRRLNSVIDFHYLGLRWIGTLLQVYTCNRNMQSRIAHSINKNASFCVRN